MPDRTAIEWTHATWNPVTGCTKVSAGCDHCYAERIANRLLRNEYRRKLPIVDTPTNRQDPFAVRIWPDRLTVPSSWLASRRIFVNSMSDLFHRDVPAEFVRRCFEVMLQVDHHSYQILTKRPARAARFINVNHADLFGDAGLPAHIWIGTSVENQSMVYRVRQLNNVLASVRFLSCEPLLGPLDIAKELTPSRNRDPNSPHIDWVIAGGESGHHARPLHPDWVRAIRDQCSAAGIPFFFKQWGGRTPKAGGRDLDGQTWNDFPDRFPHSLTPATHIPNGIRRWRP